jgi:hypothetical protein
MVRYPTASSPAKAQAEREETSISDRKALRGILFVRRSEGLCASGGSRRGIGRSEKPGRYR